MHKDFFGFRDNPFKVTPDPRVFYTNPTYERAYANLLYGICERKSLIVLTGEVGTGKTTLLRRVMTHLGYTFHFAYFSYTTLPFDELLSFLFDDLGLPQKPQGRLQQMKALKECLIAQQQQGEISALLIDEAHNLDAPLLENLLALADLTSAGESLLPIALVGQPELEKTLSHPELSRVRQMIALHCQLDRLKEREVGPFIVHRLRAVGYGRKDLFPQATVQRIAWYSQGIPRRINIICDNALLLAYAASQKTVTTAMIEEVVKDLQLKVETLPKSRPLPSKPLAPPVRLQTENLPVLHRATSSAERMPVRKSHQSFARVSVQSRSQRFAWTGVGFVLGLFLFLFFQLVLTEQISAAAKEVPRVLGRVSANVILSFNILSSSLLRQPAQSFDESFPTSTFQEEQPSDREGKNFSDEQSQPPTLVPVPHERQLERETIGESKDLLEKETQSEDQKQQREIPSRATSATRVQQPDVFFSREPDRSVAKTTFPKKDVLAKGSALKRQEPTKKKASRAKGVSEQAHAKREVTSARQDQGLRQQQSARRFLKKKSIDKPQR